MALKWKVVLCVLTLHVSAKNAPHVVASMVLPAVPAVVAVVAAAAVEAVASSPVSVKTVVAKRSVSDHQL
jgi:hypothetical protein